MGTIVLLLDSQDSYGIFPSERMRLLMVLVLLYPRKTRILLLLGFYSNGQTIGSHPAVLWRLHDVCPFQGPPTRADVFQSSLSVAAMAM